MCNFSQKIAFLVVLNFVSGGAKNVFLYSMKKSKNVCLDGCKMAPQRLKSTFFEFFFFTPGLLWLFSDPPLEQFQSTLILFIEANSALSCQNGLFPRILAHSDMVWLDFKNYPKLNLFYRCSYFTFDTSTFPRWMAYNGW